MGSCPGILQPGVVSIYIMKKITSKAWEQYSVHIVSYSVCSLCSFCLHCCKHAHGLHGMITWQHCLLDSWPETSANSRLFFIDKYRRILQMTVTVSCYISNISALFSSWGRWAVDWWRRPGMFKLLCFCSNGFSLQCNDLILFSCTMALSTMTGQSRVHCRTLNISFCNFWATWSFLRFKK